MTFVRNCGNCACGWKPQLPDGAPKELAAALMCRLNPPMMIQQSVRGAVLSTGRGDPTAGIQMVLTYPQTSPDLVCWHWRPPGSEPGDRDTPDDIAVLIAAHERGENPGR